MSDKKTEKLKDEYLTEALNIDIDQLKALKKKLAKEIGRASCRERV